jgi:hypothetical protein
MRGMDGRIPATRVWGLLAGILLGLACDPPTLGLAARDRFQSAPFAFLQEGRTTREEVLLRLGTPSAQFQEARVLSYTYLTLPSGRFLRMGRFWDPISRRAVFRGQGVHDLMLAFDERGVLRQQALVVSE